MTGGGGRLGHELSKSLTLITPDITEWDITDPEVGESVVGRIKPDLIVHAAAYTDVSGAEKDKTTCWKINVEGTANVARAAGNIPVIYISTDYVFDGATGNYTETDTPNPINYYALTKLIGEWAIKTAPNHHIIRTSFKPRPFEHDNACTDMWTSADYIDIIAAELALAIKNYQLLPRLIHIATERKSIFDLAKKSKDVKPIKRADIASVSLPRDTSLNIDKWLNLKKEQRW